jgi:hypothetical protein
MRSATRGATLLACLPSLGSAEIARVESWAKRTQPAVIRLSAFG